MIKRSNAAPPSGIKPSHHSNIPCSTTGIPTLDELIGGGITIGSLVLIESDNDLTWSKVIEKCFASASAQLSHQFFHIRTETSIPTENLFYKVGEVKSSAPKTQDSEMRIAWPYQNQSAESMMQRHPAGKVKGGMNLDLSSPLQLEHVLSRISVNSNNPSPDILNVLENFYEENKAKRAPKRQAHREVVFRTLISDFGTALWENQELEFLRKLRKITPQNSFTVLTMPQHKVTPQHRRYFDACLRIEALVPELTPSKTSFQPSSIRKMGYHGLIKLTKCNSSHCLNPYLPESNEMVFKYQKVGGLKIEVLHLPPEDSIVKDKIKTESITKHNALNLF